ncbi:MAG TPA: hypothetical protein VFR35_05015, partial [Actinoplanes sp.]|nr:hypothetical protein [Actinoplanes sp.]
MPPTPSAHSGSVRAPRPAPLEEAAEPTGRHRRPESLADINRLPLGRTPFRPLDRAPSWGHPAPDATGSSRRPSGNAFERHPRAGRHADARRANRNRGRHARPADQDPLGIT